MPKGTKILEEKYKVKKEKSRRVKRAEIKEPINIQDINNNNNDTVLI